MLRFLDRLEVPGHFETNAILGLYVGLADAYHIKCFVLGTVDRYGLHLAPCEISIWVFYLGFEE
jgi:hypothetical protein